MANGTAMSRALCTFNEVKARWSLIEVSNGTKWHDDAADATRRYCDAVCLAWRFVESGRRESNPRNQLGKSPLSEAS
jgi:hypothetical protein